MRPCWLWSDADRGSRFPILAPKSRRKDGYLGFVGIEASLFPAYCKE